MIWGTPSEDQPISDGVEVTSARAGGRYRVAGTVFNAVAALSPLERAKLTTWLVDQRRSGTASPFVTSLVLDDIRARKPLTIGQRRERFFRALMALDYQLGYVIKLAGANDKESFRWKHHLSSWTEAREENDAINLARLIVEDGRLESSGSGSYFRVSSAGWNYLDELSASGADTNQVFVAMWFGDEMQNAWEHGISPGIRDAGYEPLRIDNKQHNGKIDDEIVAEIKRSRFLVADFTCGVAGEGSSAHGIPRGGVYYEAGLAHGRGMDVIFSCRADRMGDVHFDTRQFAHLVWSTPEDLRKMLYDRIAATIGEGPGAPGRGRS
jgi:hypothetical protein